MKIFEYCEVQIIDWLYFGCNEVGRRIIVPNIYLFDWESDLISVTNAGRIHEYEVKVSKSDFKADFIKERKHIALKDGTAKNWSGSIIPAIRPNYFWYVCPTGIIDKADVPTYAGLIYYDKEKPYVRLENPIIKAPLLHKEKITDDQRTKINTSFAFKYWNYRTAKYWQ